jgi:hypothetical protein
VSDELSDEELHARLAGIPGLELLVRGRLTEADAGAGELAAAMEFALEGLHQSSLLARQEVVGGFAYRDMLAEMAQSLEG